MQKETAKILLIRHGQSTSNAEHRWQGQGNSPLSSLGARQAQWLSERLQTWHIDRIISSDLDRAHQTAQQTAKNLGNSFTGKTVEINSKWREIHVGAWEGLPKSEVAKKFAAQLASLARNEPIQIGGGESWNDLYDRVDTAFQELLQQIESETTTAIFAHGGAIHGLLRGILGIRDSHARSLGWLANTSITSLEISESEIQIAGFNDTIHLAKNQGWQKNIPLDQGNPLALYAAKNSVNQETNILQKQSSSSWYESPASIFASADFSGTSSLSTFSELLGTAISSIKTATEDFIQEHTKIGSDKKITTSQGWLTQPQHIQTFIQKLINPTHNRPLLKQPHDWSASHLISNKQGTFLADYNIPLLE